MENIYDFGRVSYKPAESIKKFTIFEKLLFLCELLIDIIKVLVLSVPHWCISLYRVFVSPRKKSVVGQTVLVTGGGNGIGKEIAILFASEGCNLAIADLDFQAAQKTAEELNEMKIIARAYHVDITNTDQIKQLKVDIEKDMPPVDILVNNAGIIPMLSLREGTEKDVERIIQVNVTAQIHVTRTFLPGMIERKRGHILGLSSLVGIHPVGGAVIYSATKGAIHNFIVGLNEEMRQEGNDCIKCTSILPYITTTRSDIVEAAHFRFPLLSPRYTARIAVDATLRNEVMVIVPRIYKWLPFFTTLLPSPILMLFRDIILKEKGAKLFSEENKKRK